MPFNVWSSDLLCSLGQRAEWLMFSRLLHDTLTSVCHQKMLSCVHPGPEDIVVKFFKTFA